MTRQPRPFGPDLRDSFLPPDALKAIGVEPHQAQQNVLAYTPTKADAEATLVAVGFRSASRSLRVRMGNDVDALLESGSLEPGSVYLWSSGGGNRPVVRVVARSAAHAHGVYERIGTFHPEGTFVRDDTTEFDVVYDIDGETLDESETGAAATGRRVADLLADPNVTRVEVTRR